MATFKLPYTASIAVPVDFIFTLQSTPHGLAALPSATLSALASVSLVSPLDPTNPRFAVHVELPTRHWVGTNVTADFNAYIFPLGATVIAHSFALTADCGAVSATVPAHTFNLGADSTCANYLTGFAGFALNATCISAPQPREAVFYVPGAFTAPRVETMPTIASGVVPASCFRFMAVADSALITPVGPASLGRVPLVRFTYTATSLALNPEATHLNLQPILGGALEIISGEVLDAGMKIYFDAADANAFDFSQVTVGGASCALAAKSALTLSVELIGSFVPEVPFSCTVQGLRFAYYSNHLHRAAASDPFKMLASAMRLRTPGNPLLGVIAEADLELRPTNAPDYFWRVMQVSRHVAPAASSDATHFLVLGLDMFLTPVWTQSVAPAWQLTTVCAGLAVTVQLAESAAVSNTTIALSAQYALSFDVAEQSLYSIESTCFSLSFVSGSMTAAWGGDTTVFVGAVTRPFDFLFYPVGASVTTAVDPSVNYTSAPVTLTWELTVYPHGAAATLVTDWGFVLRVDNSEVAALIAFAGSAMTVIATGSDLGCSITVTNATTITATHCAAVPAHATARFFQPRTLRFSATVATFGEYEHVVPLVRSGALLVTALGQPAFAAINTDLGFSRLDPAISKPSFTVLLSERVTVSAIITGENTTTPDALALTNQIFLLQFYFIQPITNTNAFTSTFQLATRALPTPNSGHTDCAYISGSDSNVACTFATGQKTALALFTTLEVPFELGTFDASDFQSVLALELYNGEMAVHTLLALNGGSLLAPAVLPPSTFAFQAVLSGIKWAGDSFHADLNLFLFLNDPVLANQTLSVTASATPTCGVLATSIATATNVTTLNLASSCNNMFSADTTLDYVFISSGCGPTPVNRFVNIKLVGAYSLVGVNASGYGPDKGLDKSCFRLTTHPVNGLYQESLGEVAVGALPPKNVFMVQATLQRETAQAGGVSTARLDTVLVLTTVIQSATITIALSMLTTSDNCPSGVSFTAAGSAGFHARSSNCAFESATQTDLIARCNGGPFFPADVFAFGYSSLSTESEAFDAPAYWGSRCLEAILIADGHDSVGNHVHPPWTHPMVSASLGANAAGELIVKITLAELRLQPTSNLEFVVSLAEKSSLTMTPFAAAEVFSSGAVDWTAVHANGAVTFTPTMPTGATSVCTQLAPCVLSVSVERAATLVNSFDIVSIMTTDGTDMSPYASVPIASFATPAQQACAFAQPQYITATATVEMSADEVAVFTVTIALDAEPLAHLTEFVVVSLPTATFLYSAAKYSVVVDGGVATTPASVESNSVTLSLASSNAHFVVTVTDVTAPFEMDTAATFFVISHVATVGENNTVSDLLDAWNNLGFATETTIVVSSTTASTTISTAPVVVAADCTSYTSGSEQKVICSVSWPELFTSTSATAPTLILHRAGADAGPTVMLESAQCMHPVATLLTPAVAGGPIAMQPCLATTGVTRMNVVISSTLPLVRDSLELRLVWGRARAVALLAPLGGGPMDMTVDNAVFGPVSGLHSGALSVRVTVPVFNTAAEYSLELSLLGGTSTSAYFILGTGGDGELTLEQSGNMCALTCSVVSDVSAQNGAQSLSCFLTPCTFLAEGEWVVHIASAFTPTHIAEEATLLRVNIFADIVVSPALLYTGAIALPRLHALPIATVHTTTIAATSDAAATTEHYELDIPASLCNAGAIALESSDVIELVLPQSALDPATMQTYNDAVYTLSPAWDMTGAAQSPVALTVQKQTNRAFILSVAAPYFICLGAAHSAIKIAFRSLVAGAGADYLTFTVLSAGGQRRYVFTATLPTDQSTLPLPVTGRITSRAFEVETVPVLELTFTGLSDDALNGMALSLSFDANCHFVPVRAHETLTIGDNLKRLSFQDFTTDTADSYPVSSCTILPAVAGAGPFKVVVPGVYCVSSISLLTVTSTTGTTVVTLSDTTVASDVTQNIAASQYGFFYSTTADGFPADAVALPSELPYYPTVFADVDLLDFALVVTSALGVPPGHSLTVTLPWVSASAPVVTGAVYDIDRVEVLGSIVGTASSASQLIVTLAHGWPVRKPLLVLFRNVTVDAQTAQYNAVYTVSIASASFAPLENAAYATEPLRSDFGYPASAPATVVVAPVPFGSSYDRSLSIELSVTVPAGAHIIATSSLALFLEHQLAAEADFNNMRLFVPTFSQTTMQCSGFPSVELDAPKIALSPFAHDSSGALLARPTLHYSLHYTPTAFAADTACVIRTSHLRYGAGATMRNLLSSATPARVAMRLGNTASKTARYFTAVSSASITSSLTSTTAINNAVNVVEPLVPLAFTAGTELDFLSKSSTLATVGPVPFYSSNASPLRGFAGLGDKFSIALRLHLKSLPNYATRICFTLPSGTSSQSTIMLTHMTGTSFDTIPVAYGDCPAAGNGALLFVNTATTHADPAADLAALLPATCGCTTSVPAAFAQTADSVTVVFPDVFHTARALDSFEPSEKASLFTFAFYNNSKLVSSQTLATPAIPAPRNRLIPRNVRLATSVDPLPALSVVAAAATSLSGNYLYVVSEGKLYSIKQGVTYDSTGAFREPQLSASGAAWVELISDLDGARYAITVAPDETTLFVNVDNRRILVIETASEEAFITADVSLPELSLSSAALGNTELPLHAPILLAWHLRSAGATVTVAAGSAVHVYSLSFNGFLSFSTSLLPFAADNTAVITAVAGSPFNMGFVVCARVLQQGSACVLLFWNANTVTTIFTDDRDGATVTSVDICHAASNGRTGSNNCVFIAVRLFQNDDFSIIHRVNLESLEAITAAVVPGGSIVDMKLTAFAHQIVLLKLASATTGVVIVLSRTTDDGHYETTTVSAEFSISLLSNNAAFAQLSAPALLSMANREVFIVSIGKPDQWLLVTAMPTLKAGLAAAPTSSELSIKLLGVTAAHDLFLSSRYYDALGNIFGETVNVSAAIRTAYDASTVNTFKLTLSLATAPAPFISDYVSSYTAMIPVGPMPTTLGPAALPAAVALRLILQQSGTTGFAAVTDIALPEYSWFALITPSLIAAQYSVPVFGETGRWRAWFASPNAVHDGAVTWSFAQPYGVFAAQTVEMRAINVDWVVTVDCVPTGTAVTCTPRGSPVTSVIAGAPLVLAINLEVTLSDPASLFIGATALTASRGATPVATPNGLRFPRPAMRPSGALGYSHRAPAGHLPSTARAVSWNANTGSSLCYAHAAGHHGCFKMSYQAYDMTGDWSPARAALAAPAPNAAAAYGAQGTLVSLVSTSGSGLVDALRFHTLAGQDPQPAPHNDYLDLPFDRALFAHRLGLSGAAHMHVVSSAELTGALVIVYNDDAEVVMLVRLNPRTLRASGADNVLTRELLQRIQSPINFSSAVAGDVVVAALDWTADEPLLLGVASTRVAFFYRSGAVRVCHASIRENLGLSDRSMNDILTEHMGFSCPDTLTLSESPITVTAAALHKPTGEFYVATKEGLILTAKLSVVGGAVIFSAQHVPVFLAVCPVATLAVHPTGQMLMYSCADSATIIPVRILRNGDLDCYILPVAASSGHLVHVPRGPTRDLSRANIAAALENEFALYYTSTMTAFTEIVSMAYSQHGAYLAVMGSLNGVGIVELFRSTEEPDSTTTMTSRERGALSSWTIEFSLGSFVVPTMGMQCTITGPQSSSFAEVTQLAIDGVSSAFTVDASATVSFPLPESVGAIITVTVDSVRNPIAESEHEPSVSCSPLIVVLNPEDIAWSTNGLDATGISGPARMSVFALPAVNTRVAPAPADSYAWKLSIVTLDDMGVPREFSTHPPYSTAPIAIVDEHVLARVRVLRLRLKLGDGTPPPCTFSSGAAEIVVSMISGEALSTLFVIYCTASTALANPLRVERTAWVGTLQAGSAIAEPSLLTSVIHIRPTYTLTTTPRVAAPPGANPTEYPAGVDIDIAVRMDATMVDSTNFTLQLPVNDGDCSLVAAEPPVAAPEAELTVSIVLPDDVARIVVNTILLARMRCMTPTSSGVTVALKVETDKGFAGALLPPKRVYGSVYAVADMPVPFEFEIGAAPVSMVDVTVYATPAFASATRVRLELLRSGLPLAVPCEIGYNSQSLRELEFDMISSFTIMMRCVEAIAPKDKVSLAITVLSETATGYNIVSNNPIIAWLRSQVKLIPVYPPALALYATLPIFTPMYIELAVDAVVNRFTNNSYIHTGGDACAFAPASALAVLDTIRTQSDYANAMFAGIITPTLTARFSLQDVARKAVLMICSLTALNNTVTVTLVRAAESHLYPPRFSMHPTSFTLYVQPKLAVVDTTFSPLPLSGEAFATPVVPQYFFDDTPVVLELQWALPATRTEAVKLSVSDIFTGVCAFRRNGTSSSSLSMLVSSTDAMYGVVAFELVCTSIRESEIMDTRITNVDETVMFAQWQPLQMHLLGRVRIAAAGDMEPEKLNNESVVQEFPLNALVPIEFAFSPALPTAATLELSFTSSTAQCTFAEQGAAQTQVPVASGAASFSITVICTNPASVPPHISARVIPNALVYYAPFLSAPLQTRGTLTFLIDDAPVETFDFFVVLKRYTITATFSPAPLTLQTIAIKQMSSSSDCVFEIGSSAAIREPIFVQKELSEPFTATMTCRRAHNIGSVIIIEGNAYIGVGLGPTPAYGLISLDFIVPAGIVGVDREITDLDSRDTFSLTAAPSGAAVLPSPYYLRSPAANVTALRVRMIPAVLSPANVRVSFTSNVGMCGFTTYSTTGVAQFSTTATLQFVLGDTYKLVYASCAATSNKDVSILTEVVAGNIHLPVLSVPLHIRGSVFFTTALVEASTAFSGEIIANKDWFFTLRISPIAELNTTLTINVQPLSSITPVCAFRTAEDASIGLALVYGPMQLVFDATTITVDIAINCQTETEFGPAIIAINNEINSWYDRFSGASFRVRGAAWVEDPAVVHSSVFPLAGKATMTRLAVQMVSTICVRLLPAPTATAAQFTLSASDAACTFAALGVTNTTLFSATLSLTVPVGVSELFMSIYCSATLPQVFVLLQPFADVFYSDFTTTTFPVENRFTMPDLPALIYVQEPTMLSLSFLPGDAISPIGRYVTVNVSVDSTYANCYGAPIREVKTDVPLDDAWVALASTSMRLTAAHTVVLNFWIKCAVYTQMHNGTAANGAVVPKLQIVRLDGMTFIPFTSAPIGVTLIDCQTLPALFRGAVTYESHGYGMTNYLAVATAACTSGFSLTPSPGANTTCITNTAVTPAVTTCVQTMTCRATGWSAPLPTCGVFSCGALPAKDPHGTAPVLKTTAPEGDLYAFGAVYEYGCESGFTLNGAAAALTCTAGGWSSVTAPLCVPVECPLHTLTNNVGNVVYSPLPYGARKYQSVATFECLAQHEHTDGDMVQICQASGEWSGRFPICRSNTCVGLQADAAKQNPIVFTRNNKTVTIETATNTYFAGTTATYSCANGYIWDKDTKYTERVCIVSEGWQPVDPPRCVPQPCPALSVALLGYVTQSPASLTNMYGVTATLTCDYGAYVSHTNASITCTATGAWSGPERTCLPYSCGIPRSISNADVAIYSAGQHGSYGSYLNTSWVEYQCYSGYNMRYTGYTVSDGTGYVAAVQQRGVNVLAARRECTPKGWTPAFAPNCEVNQCGELTVPEHGDRIYYADTLNTGNSGLTPYSYGTTASYTCSVGFEPRNPITGALLPFRRCGTEAEGWVPAVNPLCSAVDCGAPTPEIVLYAQPIKYEFDDTMVEGPTRYMSKAVYTCETGFILSGGSARYERTCTASGTWLPASPTCHDIDECDKLAFGGMYYVDCAALFGPHSKCVNTFGSYVCTPYVTLTKTPVNIASTAGTVEYHAATREVIPSNARGGQIVRFTVAAGAHVAAPYITRVQYTNPNKTLYANPELLTYECRDVSATVAMRDDNGAPATFYVQCTLVAGQGAGLYIRLQYCVRPNAVSTEATGSVDCTAWNWAWSNSTAALAINSGVVISYPMHAFVPFTLHTITASGPTQRTNDYVSLTSLGENVGLDVDNLFLDRPDLISIMYGLGTTPDDYPFPCIFNRDLSTLYSSQQRTIVCRTKDSVNELDLRFRLTIAHRVAISTDRYSYPQIPIVNSVFGCPQDDYAAGSTSGCPTDSGDVRLTVSGSGFLEPLSALISGRQCSNVVRESHMLFTCRLPAGTGSGLSLIVKAGTQRYEGRNRISYAVPTLTSITGCERVSDTVIRECAREGGSQLVLRGENFGSAGTSISIGGLLCKNVTHVRSNPHRELTCYTPGNSAVDRTVTVMQRYGELTREEVLLSYVQCPPGQHNDGLLCSLCAPGTANDMWSQSYCRECIAGFYSNTTGASSCLPCPVGTYSELGSTTCTQCPRGTFSQERAATCTQCAPGTFAEHEGSAQCEACPLGAEHTVDYSYCHCKVGSYMTVDRRCVACMSGADCSYAGVSVYNVKSLPSFAPSVNFRDMPHVARITVPVAVPGTTDMRDARRVALAKTTKLLFDSSTWPRERFVLVDARVVDANTVTVSSNQSVATLSIVSEYVPVLPPLALMVTIDVTPASSNKTDDSPTHVMAIEALTLLNAEAARGEGTLQLMAPGTYSVEYARAAITSFQGCFDTTCSADNTCLEGHSGPLCTVCKPGYGKVSTFKCGRCNEPAVAYLIMIATFAAAVVVCGVLSWKQIVDGRQSMNELRAPAVPLLLKIGMSGMQVMAIASKYDLRWPAFLAVLFAGADSAVGVGTAMLSLDCFLGEKPAVNPFWVTSIGIMFLPLMGLLLPMLFFTPRYIIARREYRKTVIATILEQRRVLVEIVTEYEAFARTRQCVDAHKDRNAKLARENADERAVFWDGVSESDDLGILAMYRIAASSIKELYIHEGINLDDKDSALSPASYAEKASARRRSSVKRSRPSRHSEADSSYSIASTASSTDGAGPLAPPGQPPSPTGFNVAAGKQKHSASAPNTPASLIKSSRRRSVTGLRPRNLFPSPTATPQLSIDDNVASHDESEVRYAHASTGDSATQCDLETVASREVETSSSVSHLRTHTRSHSSCLGSVYQSLAAVQRNTSIGDMLSYSSQFVSLGPIADMSSFRSLGDLLSTEVAGAATTIWPRLDSETRQGISRPPSSNSSSSLQGGQVFNYPPLPEIPVELTHIEPGAQSFPPRPIVRHLSRTPGFAPLSPGNASSQSFTLRPSKRKGARTPSFAPRSTNDTSFSRSLADSSECADRDPSDPDDAHPPESAADLSASLTKPTTSFLLSYASEIDLTAPLPTLIEHSPPASAPTPPRRIMPAAEIAFLPSLPVLPPPQISEVGPDPSTPPRSLRDHALTQADFSSHEDTAAPPQKSLRDDAATAAELDGVNTDKITKKRLFRILDDSKFIFQMDFLENAHVSEAALAGAYAASNEDATAQFERTAREVEMFSTIAYETPFFDADASRHAMKVSKTTEQLVRVPQSDDDLENIKLLATVPFGTLYNAELLRERVLSRERAFQRVRAEDQLDWYINQYGEKEGRNMFDTERAKRLRAEPPKLTAAEMRIKLSVAESQYNDIFSEFSGYAITTITVIMFMLHPNITRQFFTMLSCKNVGGTDDPSATVVLGDMNEICYSSQHIFFVVTLGLPMLIFWVVGIPFFAWYMLFRNRELIMMPATGASAIMRNQKSVFESQMAFLYRGYKPKRYYWFLVEMARKACLVAIAVFLPGALHTQLMLASLLIFLSILIQIVMRPFENKIPELAELFSLFTSFMVFFLANFLFVETISDAAKTVVTVLICLLVLAFALVIVAAFVMLTREEASLEPLVTALREAHAQNADTAPVMRAWRIKLTQEAAASQVSTDKLDIARSAAAAAVAEQQLANERTFETTGFHVAAPAGDDDSAHARRMKSIRNDAMDAHSLVAFMSSVAASQAAQRGELNSTQRGACIAVALDAGHDIAAALDTVSITGIDESEDARQARLVAEAQMQVQENSDAMGYHALKFDLTVDDTTVHMRENKSDSACSFADNSSAATWHTVDSLVG